MHHITCYRKPLFISVLSYFLLALGLSGCDSPAASTAEESSQVVNENKAKTIMTESGLKIKMTDLGSLGSTSTAYAINDKGQVIGRSLVESPGIFRAFIWEDGQIAPLKGLDAKVTTAYSINNKSQIVGGADVRSTYNPDLYYLYDGGNITEVCHIRPTANAFNLINDNSQVIGYKINSSGKEHAYIWDNDNLTDLGTLLADGSGYSRPFAINNKGQVVGVSWPLTEDNARHAFLWDEGTMTDLGTLGGSKSHAYAINNQGIVVGQSSIPSNRYHAFIWKDGKMTDLGILDRDHTSAATSINDHGQVVGYDTDSYGETSHALLWQDGQTIDLGALGEKLGFLKKGQSRAYAINNEGQIVGSGWLSSGESHAVLWEIVE